MKTYCKHINPIYANTIVPYIWNCYDGNGNGTGKWRRDDYIKLLSEYSEYSVKQIRDIVTCGLQHKLLERSVYSLAMEISNRIITKDLKLLPVVYEFRKDSLSGKTRLLGHESTMQQVMEHVASGCLSELFSAKFSPYQFASIKGKGQVSGVKAIQKVALKDYHATRYAKKHHNRYICKYSYFAKLDIKQCYMSIKKEYVMSLLSRDISKNKTLLWFIEALLKYHRYGLIVGSVLSKDLCNYILSYVYREVMAYHKNRGNKRVKFVTFALLFMDDILLIGPNRRNLKIAIRDVQRYIYEMFGLTIKHNWHIKDWRIEPIDIMGYKIYHKGVVTIRSRIFLRARRLFTSKTRMTLKKARRLLSYNGYFKHSNSNGIRTKLDMKRKILIAKAIVSEHDRKEALLQNEHRTHVLQRLSETGIYSTAA